MPKFIQITGDTYGPYALDENGRVWKYVETSRQICEGDHSKHQCEWQTVKYWKKFTEQCGFPGWPPTEKELAEAEVEKLLNPVIS